MSFYDVSISGERITSDLFGGNVLANRNGLHEDGGHAEAIEDLGVTGLRFPGGTLTEDFFDIGNPDSSVGIHSETGQVSSMIPLTDFMNYAAENGHSVTIVLPTRHYLSEGRDENGDRSATVDEEQLREFVKAVASGQYGTATIDSFEIGNEYWHSADMTSVEYGKVAAEVTRIIDSEMADVSESYPEAGNIDIIVQMGYNSGTADLDHLGEGLTPGETISQIENNYDLSLDSSALYSSGRVNFGNITNQMIIDQFVDADILHAVDGVVTHVYSWGSGHIGSRSFLLDQIENSWMEELSDLDIHVTEWNVRGFSGGLSEDEDYGLFQAVEMLNLVEIFMEYGVDSANVWPLIQRTDNALSTGNEYGATNAPGAFFKMMAGNMPGKVQLDFNPERQKFTEAEFENYSVHGFADETELLLYVTPSHREGTVVVDFDLNDLVSDFEDIEIQILGVADGSRAGSNESASSIITVDYSSVNVSGVFNIELDPGEIVQVIVGPYTPAPILLATLEAGGVHFSEKLEDLSGAELGSDDQGVTINGSTGDDILTGDDGDDVFRPSHGDDTMIFGGGADLVYGDSGFDIVSYFGSQSSVVVDLAGVVAAGGEAADDTLFNIEGLMGTQSNDELYGDSDHNLLVGYDGSDRLDGREGDDKIYGGEGGDDLLGRDGDDLIFGGAGSDDMPGGNGNDTLYGDDGNDALGGGNGDDYMFGGNHNDNMGGGSGNDYMEGNAGNDVMSGGYGGDALYGGDGHDMVAGSFGNDITYGGDGDDLMGGGRGHDLIYGGAGNDTVGSGEENDMIYGGSGSDELNAGDGDDQIFGGLGDDRINAGGGNDLLSGGAGMDTFVFNTYTTGEVDVIEDFTSGEDVLRMAQVSGTDAQTKLDSLGVEQVGADAHIYYKGHEIKLLDTDAVDLSLDDIWFV